MNPYENAIWHCTAIECLERLPSASQDLILLSAKDTGVFNANYDGYDEFLYKKIQQLRRVVSDEGIVFMESGENYLHLARKYLEETFGRRCFVREFIVPVGFTIGSDGFGNRPAYATLVGYAKRPGFQLKPILISDKEVEEVFRFSDEKGRYRKETLHWGFYKPNHNYEWNGFPAPERGSWRLPKTEMDRLLKEGEIDISGAKPVRKRYLQEKDKLRHAPVLWDDLAWAGPHSGHGRHKSYRKRLVRMTAQDNYRVLELSTLGGSLVDHCIDKGYSYLGLPAIPKKIKTEDDLYRKVIQEIGCEDVDQIPYEPFRYKRLEISKEDKIANLILTGETQEVEFKESAAYNHRTGKKDKDLITKILKVIVALANTKTGGTLLVGVTDDGNLVDLRKEEYQVANPQKRDSDGYCLYLNDCIGKGISKLVLGLCIVEILNIDDADLCVIQVRPSERPVFYKGDYYRRQGTQDQKFTTEDFYDKIMLDEMKYGANRMAIL